MAKMKLPPKSNPDIFLGCQNLKLSRFGNLSGFYSTGGNTVTGEVTPRALHGLNSLTNYSSPTVSFQSRAMICAGCQGDREEAPGEAVGDLGMWGCGGS